MSAETLWLLAEDYEQVVTGQYFLTKADALRAREPGESLFRISVPMPGFFSYAEEVEA